MITWIWFIQESPATGTTEAAGKKITVAWDPNDSLWPADFFDFDSLSEASYHSEIQFDTGTGTSTRSIVNLTMNTGCDGNDWHYLLMFEVYTGGKFPCTICLYTLKLLNVPSESFHKYYDNTVTLV